MNIHAYISATERTYRYRIRIAAPVTDEMMSRIERTLLKYDPLDISLPRKTMFQASPLDFTNVKNAEITIVDVELALPASPATLAICLAEGLGLARSFVVVRGEADPSEIETQRLDAEAQMAEEAEKRGLTRSAALSDPEYGEARDVPSADHLYGDAYNRDLLAYLKGVEDERNAAMKVDAPAALFSWLDRPADGSQEPSQGADIFNQDVEGAPGAAKTGTKTPASIAGKHGTLAGQDTSYRRVYKDASGKKVVMTRSGRT